MLFDTRSSGGARAALLIWLMGGGLGAVLLGYMFC
jgi:hypothetical protein